MKGNPKQALVHEIVETNELWHRRIAHVHYRALPIASKVVEGLPEFQRMELLGFAKVVMELLGFAKDVRKGRIQRRHFLAVKAKLNVY